MNIFVDPKLCSWDEFFPLWDIWNLTLESERRREASLAYKKESPQLLKEEKFWDNGSLIGGPNMSMGFYFF